MHLMFVVFVYEHYSKFEAGPAFIDAGDDDHDPFAYKEGKRMLRSDTVMCTPTMDLVQNMFLFRKTTEEYRLANDENRFLKCVLQITSAPMEGIFHNTHLMHKAASAMLYDRQLNS